MKIVAGKYGGRRLVTPKNRDIRPTSDKVRGAIFNMLVSRGAIEDAYVLDAFCGTGALGLEALSRGARSCEFADKSRTSLGLARENVELLSVEEYVAYTFGDVRKTLKKQENNELVHGNCRIGSLDSELAEDTENTYSLIFLDPPYNKSLIASTLGVLKDAGKLYDGAWVVCESEKNLAYDNLDGFGVEAVKEYGSTKVALLQYHEAYGK